MTTADDELDLSHEQLVPERTALVVIDMLRDYLDVGSPREIPSGRAILPRIATLIEDCRRLGVTIVYAVHAHAPDGTDLGRMGEVVPGLAGKDGRPLALVRGEAGTEIAPPLVTAPVDHVVYKTRHSAFFGTELDDLLRTAGIDTVALCGLATNYCCDSTARDALHRDYRLVVLSDCVATFDLPDRGWGAISQEVVNRVMLTTVALRMGRVLTADELKSRLAIGAPPCDSQLTRA